MHFVYKLDNLLRSIRVSDENSSITKGFHFLIYFNSRLFLHSICTIQGHISTFQPFSDFICYFSCISWFIFNMTLRFKSTANELWNGWKLAWYHNFTHVACAKMLWGLREKLDALHVQTRQSPSKYQGFGRKLIYYKGISFFKHILTQDFFAFKLHHSKPHRHFSILFWLHLLFFMHFIIYFELKWPWNWKALQMNSEMVESWHGIIFSPT